MKPYNCFENFIENVLRFRIIATDMLQALKIAERLGVGVEKNFEIKTAMLP